MKSLMLLCMLCTCLSAQAQQAPPANDSKVSTAWAQDQTEETRIIDAHLVLLR